MIRFFCDSCGKKLGVDDRLAGRRGKCPDCGFLFTVPAPGAPPAPPSRRVRQDDTDYQVDLDASDAVPVVVPANGPAPPAPAGDGADPDLLFGRLASKAGVLSEGQVEWLVDEQARLAASGSRVTLGELAQARRMLSSMQVQRLLLAQEYAVLRGEDRRLGVLAVRNGFATDEEVALALDQQKRSYQDTRSLPGRLGGILMEMGALSGQQLRALLSAQARLAGQEATRGRASVEGEDGTGSSSPSDGPARQQPAPEGEPPNGCLVQEGGAGDGRKFPLRRRAVIGRQPENEIPIEDDEASRQHARIEYVPLGRQHVLIDLNSRNGTCVNGDSVEGPIALHDGDRVRIGGTVLRYVAGADVAAEGVSPDETRVAPQRRMGSQLRRETAAMRAARPDADGPATAQDDTVGADPPSEVERADPSADSGTTPRHRRGIPRRKAVMVGGVLLAVGALVWVVAPPDGQEAAPIVAVGPTTQGGDATAAVPPSPPTFSGSGGSATAAPIGPPSYPLPPTPVAPIAAQPVPPAVPAPADIAAGDRRREAMARIEQAKDRIARGEFEEAQALLQEALSADPDSEAEILRLFDVAEQGLQEQRRAAVAPTQERQPTTPEPAAPNAPSVPEAGSPTIGRSSDEPAAPLLASARAHERNGKLDLAIQKYREILADYAGTAAAGEAKGRLAALRLSCRKCQGLGMNCPDCDGKRTTYTTCAMCNGAGKGAGSMQAGKAGKMQSTMCPRCNGSCKHDEMCRKCGGEGRVRCSVCWALPALDGSPSSQRGKKEPDLLGDWSQNLALMVTGREGWTVADYAAMEKELRARRAGAGESPATIADSLGAALMAQGKFKEASDCFAKSLSLRKEALGKDAPEVGDCFLEFGVLNAARGKTAAALLNLDQAHLVYMTAWNAARNKEFFLLVWGAATESQPEGLAKDAMEVAQSEGRRQVKEEIDSIAARMERANLLRDLIETCELRWRDRSSARAGEDAPPRASDGADKPTQGREKGDSGDGNHAANREETETCPTCEGRGTVPCTSCTDGKASGDCPTCLGTGSPSAARAGEWREHMETANAAMGSMDYGRAERELRAALRIAQAFGEHDVRHAETLIALGGLLQGMNQRSEGEGMVKRGEEIVEYLAKNRMISEEKKCAKCKGTGQVAGACPECKGKRVVPCPDCRGKKAGGGGGASDDERANSLLTVAQAFETNKKPDLAIQKYQEIVAKYPDTEAAATAKKRLEELQAGGSGK